MDNMVLILANKHNYQDATERSEQTAIPDNQDFKNSVLVILLVMNIEQTESPIHYSSNKRIHILFTGIHQVIYVNKKHGTI